MSSDLQERLEPFQEDFSLMIEGGFVAIKQLDEIMAGRLFHAAKTLRPDSTAPDIGLGYIHLNKLECDKAAELFLSVLEREPDNQLARSFLGMSYMLDEKRVAEGEELVREAMSKTEDPTVKHLGKTALEWCDKDLKKKKAPFFES